MSTMPSNRVTGEGRHPSRAGVLVLCEPHDLSALWAAEGLSRQVEGPVDLVTGSMLACALTWEHRIRGDVAEVDIALADGRRISSTRARPVLNRLSFVPTDRLASVAGDDRDYAIQEFQALFLSWLWAHPGPMLNRPSPQFLAGHWRHPAAWAVLAAKAGLCTAPYRQRSDDALAEPGIAPAHRWRANQPPSVTVFVVGRQVVSEPAVPPPLLDPCRRLAELAGDDLLGIELAPMDSGRWELVTATPIPDLRAGGEPLLDALARALGARA
jgi:hypothetical protein